MSKRKCVATIIKKLDLLLLFFPQFALPVFLLLLYLSFHYHHHTRLIRFFVVVFIVAAI